MEESIMAVIGKHGITADTPKNTLLGAGTYMRGLKFQDGEWTGTVLGATNGGGKLAITGEFYDLPVDGQLVKVKGMTVKMGGTVTAEVSFAELSTSVIQIGTLFEAAETDAEGYTMLKDKAEITEGDYVENFGFVGYTANNAKRIIFIMENALCTSGMEIETKNKEAAVVKLTMEAYANNEGNLDTLPVKIYYPDDPMV
jgi:hypothetical protein